MIIGITGGTGCGKTTLLEAIKARGGLVLDCDAIYHRLLQTDKKMLAAIEARFPGTVQEGILQRKKLGAIVFADEQALLDLNRITHSAVKNEVQRQLDEYFSGERKKFDLPLRPNGTKFQLADWMALQEIPYGETVSYGDIARAIGKPKAFRAVGMANHNNPISIIVPCHRVIGSDGKLTGYGGGLEIKRYLLDLEQKWK